MIVEEAILERVRALPPEKQEEVLRFAESLSVPQECEKKAVNIDHEIAKMAAELPEDKRAEFLKWADYLKAGSPGGPPFRNLRGVCANLGPAPSEEDIAEARREMWGEYVAGPGR
jgi:hypothetical protein